MTLKSLIIEDTPANRLFFERLLKQAGFDTLSATSGKEAINLGDKHQIELAIIDVEMPDMSGLEIVTRLRRNHPDACLIIATMHDSRSLQESAFKRGCDIFLVKPHGFMELYKQLTSVGTTALHENAPFLIDQYGFRSYKMLSQSR